MSKLDYLLNGEQDFFTWTNPLFYIYILLLIIVGLLNKIFQLSGINDWYTAIFKVQNFTIQQKQIIVNTHKKEKREYFS